MNRFATMRLLLRTARGARLRWLSLIGAVALGVSAVVGVHALNAAVEQGIRLQTRALLGGDLAVESRRPLPDLLPYLPASQRDARHVRLTVLSTMVRSQAGRSRLVEVKAVEAVRGTYPLAGQLETEPAGSLTRLLDDHAALVAPQLLSELGVALGDTLFVGGEPLRIAGVVKREPDPIAFSFQLGPRVLITQRALARTPLLGFGNRVRHRALFAFGDQVDSRELARVQAALRRTVPGGDAYVSIETHTEAQPVLRKTLERAARFFALVGLLSLLVASIGVAQSVSAWLAQSLGDTAILRCLGLRPREVFWLYLSQIGLVSLAGSMLGALVGTSLPLLLTLAPPVLPIALGRPLPLAALGHGFALGMLIPMAFSLPPLVAVWRAPPALVLRSEAAPLAAPRALRVGLLALAACAACAAGWLESGNASVGLAFSASIAALTGVCWLAAWALMRMAACLPMRRAPALLRHGVAALARPAAGTTGGVIALGLGTLVVLAIVLLDGMVGRALEMALPDGAPSVFLLDVQPDQWPAVEQLAQQLGATRIDSVPIVMARLLAVDGRDVPSMLRGRPGETSARQREQWVLTREQRISWAQTLPDDNRIVEGALWSDPQRAEVSVEEGFARELGARLGSVLRFDVQGVPQELTVTSIRTIEWRSFAANFFLVAEPHVLDEAPHFRLGALRLPEHVEQALQDRLAASLPNVTVLRARGLLAQARGVLTQLATATRLVGGFAVLTGLAALASSVVAVQARRAREAALWKALGLTRLRVTLLFAVEYALSGAIAGLVGSGGAYLLSLAVGRWLLSLQELPEVATCALAVGATSALATCAGLLASAHALTVAPIQVLPGR